MNSLSGSDTIIINNRVLNDLGTGDCVHLTYPNGIADAKVGKNGNTIYSFNESGKLCEVVLMVLRGSDDDKFLLNLLTLQQNNFPSTVLMVGEFIKQIGDGLGNIAGDTYVMSGGIFTKQVEAKDNVEGDVAQSMSEYHLKFSNAPRSIT